MLTGLSIALLAVCGATMAMLLILWDPLVHAVAAAATVVMLTLGRPICARLIAVFKALAARPLLAVTVVGLINLLLSIALGLWHLPIPGIRDEFAYLLTADTFQNGRLVNPVHPLWQHFASEYVLVQPFYQAKYPPGQGLVLAFGQAVFGHPIAGVWLNLALGCAALCWMLQAWLPPRWALLGALLTATSANVLVAWGQSYWGGALALTGGALLFGALPRLVRRPAPGYAALLALGAVMLAYSRPYEGAVACLPALLLLMVWLFKAGGRAARARLRILLPAGGAVLLAGGLWLGYYHYQVTGDPLVMPYQVWFQQHRQAAEEKPEPVVSSATPVSEAAARLQREFNRGRVETRRPLVKIMRQFMFYIGIAMVLPFVLLPLTLRNRWMRFAALVWVLDLVAIQLNGAAGFPHYTAPAAAVLTALLMQGLRHLRAWRRRRLGATLVAALVTFALCLSVSKLTLVWAWQPVPDHLRWSIDRDAIEQRLLSAGGRHLVVVRYSEDHFAPREWVYNRAQIDDATIVWAKELDARSNDRLLEYFDGRRVWLLEADNEGGRLRPYQRAAD